MTKDPQEVLSQLVSLKRPIAHYEQLLATYQYALLQTNETHVSVMSLLNPDGYAWPTLCPRDRENVTLVVDGKPLFGYDACRRCVNCMTCLAPGHTREFILASHLEHPESLDSRTQD